MMNKINNIIILQGNVTLHWGFLKVISIRENGYTIFANSHISKTNFARVPPSDIEEKIRLPPPQSQLTYKNIYIYE